MESFNEIIKDSLKYPVLDFKKFLILGIFILSMTLLNDLSKTIPVFFVLACLIGLFIVGYIFRIVKLSLNKTANKLPEFNSWLNMFVDGLKVVIIGIVYTLPIILVLLIINPASFLQLVSWLLTGISVGQIMVAFIFTTGPLSLAVILYMLLIIPVLFMAVIHMFTKGVGELSFAFKFSEIFGKIIDYGFKNIIGCYLVVGFFVLIIFVVGTLFTSVLWLLNPYLWVILFSLVVAPYFYMFIARLIVLSYKSELQMSKKVMISLFVGIIGFLVISFLIFNMISDTAQNSNIQVYNATTNTYSTHGVSFNYPSNWSINTQTQGRNYEIYIEPPLPEQPNNTNDGISISSTNSRDSSQFIITIEKNRYGISDTDKINSILKEPNAVGWQLISNNTLTVDGNAAYEKTLFVNDSASYGNVMILQSIYIIKNGTTYTITSKAPANDFENQKSIFNDIINSFKIQ